MTPWEEVRSTGKLGLAGARLLYKVVAVVVRRHNIPHPENYSGWTTNAIYETAHDFVAGPGGMGRFEKIAWGCDDDESFSRILHKAVLNHLRTEGRRTETGKLAHRLTKELTQSSEFAAVPHGERTMWRLHGQPDAYNRVPHESLVEAISRIRVERPKWDSERRDGPLADAATYLTLLRTILARADGAMSAGDLAEVIAARLHHRRASGVVELDAKDDHEVAAAAPQFTGTETTALRRIEVRAVFSTLTDRERFILAYLDRSVRVVGDLIGLGRSQVSVIRNRLLERIEDDLGRDQEFGEKFALLCRACEAWVKDRTSDDGETSS